MKNTVVKLFQHYKYIFHMEGMYDVYRYSKPFRVREISDFPFIPEINSWIKVYDEGETYENFPNKIAHKVIDVCTSCPADSSEEPYEVIVTLAPAEIYFDLDAPNIKKILEAHNFNPERIFYSMNIDKSYGLAVADRLFEELEKEQKLVKIPTEHHRKPE